METRPTVCSAQHRTEVEKMEVNSPGRHGVTAFLLITSVYSFIFWLAWFQWPRTPIARFRSGSSQLHPVLFLYLTCPGSNSTRSFDFSRLPGASLEVRCNPVTNKIDCNEAVPILNFLLTTYDKPLAEKYVFLHAHEEAWHYNRDIFSQLPLLLSSNYFRSRSFGGVFGRYFSDDAWGPGEEEWARPLYHFLFNGTSMPTEPIRKKNQRPCCSTFFMNSELVRTRQKWEYRQIIDRLRAWSRRHMDIERGPAYWCGRVLEYNWHLLISNKSYIPRGVGMCEWFFCPW